jgi:quercetin dioxygenase-like cupin family protein
VIKICALIAAAALAASPALADSAVTPVLARDLPNVPGMRMTALTVTYEPGAASGSHHHAPHGFLIAYVLKGHIRSQVDGEPEMVYGPGDSWTEGPNAHHLVSQNASATEAAQMLVVFVAPPNETLTTPDATATAGSVEQKHDH